MIARWWKHLRHALEETLNAEDEHHRIAKGIAIGMFFGFSPLIGLKTLLALAFAFVLRSNKIAAVVGVTLHDVILPFMPIVFRLEYDVGYWLLNHPHELPPNLTTHELSIHQWLSWTTFVTAGVPLLVGSFFFSAPTSIVAYWTPRLVLHRRTLAKLKQRTA